MTQLKPQESLNQSMEVVAQKIVAQIGKSVIGKDQVIEDVFCAFLARGHVLFEDNPGVAKTLLAKSFATVLDFDFSRIQFTPDLLPSDITGGYIFNRQTNEFELKKGPVFSNVLLADEINRASPKTQSALLEAMAEGQITLEGNLQKLAPPFWVMATQNPVEHESTFALPEAQLDRFAVKLSIGYPDEALETKLLLDRMARKQDQVELEPVLTLEEALALQEQVESITVDESLVRYIVQLVQKTRSASQIAIGASPRGGLALLALARARAAIKGRAFVLPDDIKHFAIKVLAHRIVLKPELWLGVNEDRKQIEAVINSVPLPIFEGCE